MPLNGASKAKISFCRKGGKPQKNYGDRPKQAPRLVNKTSRTTGKGEQRKSDTQKQKAKEQTEKDKGKLGMFYKLLPTYHAKAITSKIN